MPTPRRSKSGPRTSAGPLCSWAILGAGTSTKPKLRRKIHQEDQGDDEEAHRPATPAWEPVVAVVREEHAEPGRQDTDGGSDDRGSTGPVRDAQGGCRGSDQQCGR